MKNYPYSYNTMKEDYAQYCVECRWNGQQPLTFVQWVCDDDDEGVGGMGLAWPNRDVIRVGTLSKALGQAGTLRC